MSLGAGRW